ncbi:hypothetical protein EZE20_03035 [Arundinibacter roseus]|uniref:Uncharacterized protein n=1 Tax=Arundinibacter roseus TaxID=2070510 RepID=A0A4R4KIC7_9BACT|nr:hypothetical protein EZE20_03035 [Arundinibacter roseus]
MAVPVAPVGPCSPAGPCEPGSPAGPTGPCGPSQALIQANKIATRLPKSSCFVIFFVFTAVIS